MKNLISKVFGYLIFNDVIKKGEGNNLDIPNGILINIASISASTIRGILFEKLKGTIVQNEIYPLIDINAMFGIGELKK